MINRAPHILIVDDDQNVLHTLALILQKDGYRLSATDDGTNALELAAQDTPDVVIQDLRMHGMHGLKLLKCLKERHPALPVIALTAFSTWQTAVQALRLGAFDYLRKPFDAENLRSVVARAVQAAASTAGSEDSPNCRSPHIIGQSSQILEINRLIRRVGPTDSTVLLEGESGTGKELVARALHSISHRSTGPFICVNCGTVTETLLESELFGHVRGAFTGAIDDKKGLFEIADHGTLFLDEVAELSPRTQVNLLRVLEDRTYLPVGGTQPRRVDVRFIAATNRNLEQDVRDGSFREDLFYRLNVIPIPLPPLRERREDIPLLAGYFLARYVKALSKAVHHISPDAMAALMQHDWPGNVRELENAIHRALAMTDASRIELSDLPENIASAMRRPGAFRITFPSQSMNLNDALDEFERTCLLDALRRTNWNITRAARLLGIPFRSMRYRIKKLRIRRPSLPSAPSLQLHDSPSYNRYNPDKSVRPSSSKA